MKTLIMLKLISSLFSYLKKERKIQVISQFFFSYLNKAKKIRVKPEIIFSYLKKRKKIQVKPEIIFSYLKKRKKNHVLLGVLFLFLIIALFSIKEPSVSDQNDKAKKFTQLDEENNYKPHELSKNAEDEVPELKKKQTAKNESSKSIEPPPKKKPLTKNHLEKSQKSKVKQVPKKPDKKDELKNFSTPKEVVNNLHVGLEKVSEKKFSNPADLINLVKNTYNAEKMIEKIIGDTWKKTNKKDQEEIVIIFQEYIARNYLKRFNKIKNPAFNYKESKKINEKFMLVKTDLVVDKEEVSVNYLLLFDNNKWRIFDVLLAGSISEIATKKSEFSSFIRDGKITPLINALKKQNSVLND